MLTKILVILIAYSSASEISESHGVEEIENIYKQQKQPFVIKDTFAIENDPISYFKADNDFVIRQRALSRVFKHYRCNYSGDGDDFQTYSEHFNPLNHLEEYGTVSKLVETNVRNLEAGKLLPRYGFLDSTSFKQIDDFIIILNTIFLKNAQLFYKTLAYFSSRCNIHYLYLALSYVISSLRTEGYLLPPPYEVIPQFFTPKDIIQELNQIQLKQVKDNKIYIATRSRKREIEGPITVFHNDPLLNVFHILWHIDFPAWHSTPHFPAVKPRKGELFFNIHHQLMKRYFAEKIALGLPPTNAIDFRKPLNPGFEPERLLLDFKEFSPRSPSIMTQDIIDAGQSVEVSSAVITSLEKLIEGIRQGFLIATNGTRISIRNDEGCNILGNALESNNDSINTQEYGNYHNMNHLLISHVMDPSGEKKLPLGLIYMMETSLTDPIFFEIHHTINEIHKFFKDFLQPYLKAELENPGIEILEFSVQSHSTIPQNELQTEFKNVSWDISNAIEESGEKCEHIPTAQVFANIQISASKPFTFKLKVNSNQSARSVVRIFMAPLETFNGSTPNDDTLRWSFFEMDKFPVQLKAGINTIERESIDNSLAPSPFYSISTLNKIMDDAYFNKTPLYVNRFNRHCGWPLNHYLPMGRGPSAPQKMRYALFAMISDFELDYPSQDFERVKRLTSESICSVVNGPWPDSRPKGFPFDRPISKFHEFLTPNMIMINVTITHSHSN